MQKINILYLALQSKWYDLIKKGEKHHEYREIKPYWIVRLCKTLTPTRYFNQFKDLELIDFCLDCYQNNKIDRYNYVHFSKGYRSNESMIFEIKEIRIGVGLEEWGAPQDKNVFIIDLGRRLS